MPWLPVVRPRLRRFIGTAPASSTNVPATGLGSAQAFGALTFVFGGVVVSVSGLASAQSFGALTAAPGGVIVPVSGVTSPQAFGSLTPSPGGTTILMSGLGTAQAFGHLTIPGTETFNPAIHGGKHF